MEKPIIVQKDTYKVEVEKGKTYFWCACGLSQKQPFCGIIGFSIEMIMNV